MRTCTLTVFGDVGRPIHHSRIELPESPDLAILGQVYRRNINGVPCRYAVAREGERVKALYLPDRYLPRDAVRTSVRRKVIGWWATSAVRLGDWGGGRALVGPEVFFRQVDLGSGDAWLAPLLMRFDGDVTVQERRVGKDVLYEWEQRGSRFFYLSRGARWALFGAGNTPAEVLDRVLTDRPPKDVNDFLWAVGAVRLGG